MNARSIAAPIAVSLFFANAARPQSATPAPGFVLFSPVNDTRTYLIDNAGVVVHEWPATSFPGLAVYLLEDGSILRTGRTFGTIPGIGGRLQRIAADGTVTWDFRLTGPSHLQHHDIEILPNGNVLAIAWVEKTRAEAIAAGRDPSLVSGPVLLPDSVFEIRPTGATSGTIVWEWHAWDHLIQDHDPTVANFGDVAANPHRIDVNFPRNDVPNGDWLHCNSVKYNPELDQIVISSRHLSEIWVIDHSTTTEEARGSTGGKSGMGGDLLYRWGNPRAYRAPGAQTLETQHDANWVPKGFPGEGNLIVFDNIASPGASSVVEIAPPVDANGRYAHTPGTAFGPTQPVWEFRSPGFYSALQGGAVRLSNGNTLVTSAMQARLFEVGAGDRIVWQYDSKLPTPGQINPIFKVRRYGWFLWQDTDTASLSNPGTVRFRLLAGSAHAGRPYVVLGSLTGTSPGVTIGSHVLPLVVDAYFLATLSAPNTAPLANSFGRLDAVGNATASFTLPPGLPPALVGLELHHAFAVLSAPAAGIDLASEAATFRLVP
jgi:hypothetical protein